MKNFSFLTFIAYPQSDCVNISAATCQDDHWNFSVFSHMETNYTECSFDGHQQ